MVQSKWCLLHWLRHPQPSLSANTPVVMRHPATRGITPPPGICSLLLQGDLSAQSLELIQEATPITQPSDISPISPTPRPRISPPTPLDLPCDRDLSLLDIDPYLRSGKPPVDVWREFSVPSLLPPPDARSLGSQKQLCPHRHRLTANILNAPNLLQHCEVCSKTHYFEYPLANSQWPNLSLEYRDSERRRRQTLRGSEEYLTWHQYLGQIPTYGPRPRTTSDMQDAGVMERFCATQTPITLATISQPPEPLLRAHRPERLCVRCMNQPQGCELCSAVPPPTSTPRLWPSACDLEDTELVVRVRDTDHIDWEGSTLVGSSPGSACEV